MSLQKSNIPQCELCRSGEGFALVIALSLMAFVVLLLLTFTTIVSVETRVANNSKSQTQAEQNALLALNIAIGQLQKYAGPDQRITGTADLAGQVTGESTNIDFDPSDTTAGISADMAPTAPFLTQQQASLIDTSNITKTALGHHAHNLSAYSTGLLSNSYHGGLREDPTFSLSQATFSGQLRWRFSITEIPKGIRSPMSPSLRSTTTTPSSSCRKAQTTAHWRCPTTLTVPLPARHV